MRTSSGGDGVLFGLPAVANESSNAAPISVCQFVNPMETEYSQNDSAVSHHKEDQDHHKVLDYDLHSMSPEPNCEVTISSSDNHHKNALKLGSPLSGIDSLENLRQRRDQVRSQIRQASHDIQQMESEIQKELQGLEGGERDEEGRFAIGQAELDR